jgi:hypothetical protein
LRDIFEVAKPQTILEKIESSEDKNKSASVINRFDKKSRKKAKFGKTAKGALGTYVASAN